MARRFRQRTSSRPRRATDWIGGVNVVPTNETTLNGQTAAFVSFFDTRLQSGPLVGPFTLIRQRGIFVVSPQAVSIEQFIIGAFGTCIVNGEAFDAGVASVITPWTDSFDDRWLYHTYFSCQNKLNAAISNSMLGQIIEIDGKGQRRVESGDVIVNVIENGSADNMTYFHNQRLLAKLA